MVKLIDLPVGTVLFKTGYDDSRLFFDPKESVEGRHQAREKASTGTVLIIGLPHYDNFTQRVNIPLLCLETGRRMYFAFSAEGRSWDWLYMERDWRTHWSPLYPS